MPYGRMRDDSVMIGSLELLQSSNVMTLFNTSDPALRTGSAGEETAAQIRAEIPDGGLRPSDNEPAIYQGHEPQQAHRTDITNRCLRRV